ncbi:hypothetical protein OESDEN_07127 [Oesophagostomum dentatum]|uniref:Uncharacterized protein n=1 Tax=Oesophagostomum dentatum TaxID=61180 RepID=A0A0B1T6V0_OESDE|nr:hypothetical protein OESDEN_07127 [Oesophagostomum dentatum]
MSDYLGWTERRPPFGAQRPPKDDLLPGGPVTQSYENYDTAQMAADHGLSASRMLKMEQTLGKHALDDSMDAYDDSGLNLRTPLESLYAELGLNKSEHALYRQFPVYMPKQSSEYFAISHGAERRPDRYGVLFLLSYLPKINLEATKVAGKLMLSIQAPLYSSYREKDDEEYAKNNRKTLIDYKDFNSSPLSPFLYQEHPYVRPQDTRIVGSNFVQVTSRPKDRFLEKVEQTLAEVRAMPRYT